MRMFKPLLASCLAAATLASVQAAPVRYDFEVSGNWFDNAGTPFGMALSPTLNGHLTVDASLAGIAGLLDFELITGSKTWTEAEFAGDFMAVLNYDGSGQLVDFHLGNFFDGADRMLISTNNTFALVDSDSDQSNACNGCVQITGSSPVNPTPEPAGLALLGLAGMAAWAARRRVRA